MKYLLDTCAISELVAKRPQQNVLDWLDQLDPAGLYLSVITIGEIRKGIEKLPDSARRDTLQNWLTGELLVRFEGQILPIDTAVSLAWGRLAGALEADGKKMAAIDSLIAATAIHNHCTLVTRNESDFKYTGVTVVNPWKE